MVSSSSTSLLRFFYSHDNAAGRTRQIKKEGRETGSLLSWFFTTVDFVHSALPNVALQTHTHTKHTHTLRFWQHKLGSLAPSISKAPPCGDWLLFLAAWKKKEKTLWCPFPSGFIWLWFCCGESALVVCAACFQTREWLLCVGETFVWGLFWGGRLTDVCVGCFFSSFNWKCSHLLLPNVYRKNKWKKKWRGKYFLICWSWSVVRF